MRIVIAIGLLLFGMAFYEFLNKVDNFSDTPNQSKQIIILRDSLEQSNKSTLYYRTQYLKANTQLIELKTKCIYCAD